MSNSQAVSYVTEGDIGIVTANNPPVNALSHYVRSGLVETLKEAEADDTKVTLIVCAGRTFFAGADITEAVIKCAASIPISTNIASTEPAIVAKPPTITAINSDRVMDAM